MKMDAMKEALEKRKGKGLDLTIIVGQPKEDENRDKMADLAPEVKPGDADSLGSMPDKPEMIDEKEESEGHPDVEQDKALFEELIKNHELKEGEEYPDKPRSLGERARMMFAKKMKGK
jgi:hypothetical protein